jgi:hypothetical protein
MNDEVPIYIYQEVIRSRFLMSGNVLGLEENCFGNGKVLRQRRVCENKFAPVCKTKGSFKPLCFHGYEDSGLQRQTVNRIIISVPFNIKLVQEKEIIILKVRNDV